jgi:thiosulfate dehydrogenase [quinone] large subunit
MPTKPEPRRGQSEHSSSTWARRRSEPGWLLLPLRAFLGVTFSYAGLQKLANPAFLDPNSPISVANQMRLLRHSSPIGPLLGLSAHAPTLVGLTIAFGELAVGVGTLLGLWSRVAALGGTLLSLTFFLTVSWSTTPYYYGPDIVFVFAWLVLVAFGSAGVLSLDAWLHDRARRRIGLRAKPATAAQREGLARRTVVTGFAAAGVVGVFTLALGGVTAAIGRAVRGTSRRSQVVAGPTNAPSTSSAAPTSPNSPATPSTAASSPAPAPGTVVVAAASVGVGQAHSFTNPADGSPAWVVHPSGSTFVAFSAVCTHAGCPVQYDASNVEFVCPCHGGVYDAKTGKVLQGPPPAPLPSIPVQVVNGEIRVT